MTTTFWKAIWTNNIAWLDGPVSIHMLIRGMNVARVFGSC